jgi:Arsenite efflux pump ACR3 and related permeases
MMEQTCEEVQLGIFEKYLALWVFLCMVIGLFLSQFIPELSIAINNLQFSGISIPIGVCLFLMMYPALLNLQFSELKKLAKNPKPIILTLVSNWIWAPLVTAFLAYYFLVGHDQLIVALILLGSSPCTDTARFQSVHGYGLRLGRPRQRKSRAECSQHKPKHYYDYVSVRAHCYAVDGCPEHSD